MATLQQMGDTCQLNYEKALTLPAEIQISLSWSNHQRFLKRVFGGGAIDLDLGCFYEMENGDRMLIDVLQFQDNGGPRDRRTRQGCFTEPPYIWHTGDDRGSNAQSIETIIVNPQGLEELRRIMAYAFVTDGDSRWAQAQASLCISVPGCDDVTITLDKPSDQRLCAIASIDIDPAAHLLTITKLLTYHAGHSACDRAYSWGFTYHKGHR
ncbi:MAG: stress protein [Bacteroidales bacterium]|nr:stress protein [Bacteroidales bacterium]